jgi:hypothetical protein
LGKKLPVAAAKPSKPKRRHDSKSDCNARKTTLRTQQCRKVKNASNLKRAIHMADYESDDSDASYNYENLTNKQMKEQDSLFYQN